MIIRAVILMNPHNPLAEIYTREEMIAFLEFAKRYRGRPLVTLHIYSSRCHVTSLNNVSTARQNHSGAEFFHFIASSFVPCGEYKALLNEVLLPLLTMGILSGAAMCQGVSLLHLLFSK